MYVSLTRWVLVVLVTKALPGLVRKTTAACWEFMMLCCRWPGNFPVSSTIAVLKSNFFSSAEGD